MKKLSGITKTKTCLIFDVDSSYSMVSIPKIKKTRHIQNALKCNATNYFHSVNLFIDEEQYRLRIWTIQKSTSSIFLTENEVGSCLITQCAYARKIKILGPILIESMDNSNKNLHLSDGDAFLDIVKPYPIMGALRFPTELYEDNIHHGGFDENVLEDSYFLDALHGVEHSDW
jgi:hypothetical protein